MVCAISSRVGRCGCRFYGGGRRQDCVENTMVSYLRTSYLLRHSHTETSSSLNFKKIQVNYEAHGISVIANIRSSQTYE
jgi:hypothetical protein